MKNQLDKTREQSFAILKGWLESCSRKKKRSRNTIAVGIVTFDHLRHKCPVTKADIMSDGGELKGSRAGLGKTLERYGISRSYLKEATTRQAHQDAQRLLEDFEWGSILMLLSDDDRDRLLVELIKKLAGEANEWLNRQNLKLDIDRADSPSSWIQLILERAKGRSGGVVEQHLVGAKLEKRFHDISVPNYPAHAADAQTERQGDFSIQKAVYHVTATPSLSVVQKCAANIRAGKHPILLVPADRKPATIGFAELEGIERQLSVISIEDFLALNIIEMAAGEGTDFFHVLRMIVETYNKRLAEVETDLSLRIEVR